MVFKSDLNWFGWDTLQLSITDRGNNNDTASIYCSVLSINDRPVFYNLPDSIMFDDNLSYSIHLWDYVDDIETSDPDLVYTLISSSDSLSINFTDSTGQLILSSPGKIDYAKVWVKVTDDSGDSAEDSIRIIIPTVTGSIENTFDLIPDRYILQQNHPNPFNPITTIIYGLPESSSVKLEIYNILGQKICTIHQDNDAAGYHTVIWDAGGFPSGIYIYRLSATGKNNIEQFRKMALIK